MHWFDIFPYELIFENSKRLAVLPGNLQFNGFLHVARIRILTIRGSDLLLPPPAKHEHNESERAGH